MMRTTPSLSTLSYTTLLLSYAHKRAMAAVAIIRTGLNGQFTLERARAAMIAGVLRMLHFHTP